MRKTIKSGLLLGMLVVVSTACVATERRVISQPERTQVGPGPAAETHAVSDSTLKVMTLNTAHGRGKGLHQVLQTASRHRRNLDRISAVLLREQPAVVALQEADGVCAWSGNFNHVRYLAENGEYAEFVRNDLVRMPGMAHGTALLSALPLDESIAVKFRPQPGGTAKGFVLSTISWPQQPDLKVDIVSLHLEAFRPGLRERQVNELIASVADRERPMIVMGDFNTRWRGRRNLLPRLAEELGLTAFEPLADGHSSLPMFNRRLDWILISEEFEFESYETLDDVLSDHRAVVAEIALRDAEVIVADELMFNSVAAR